MRAGCARPVINGCFGNTGNRRIEQTVRRTVRRSSGVLRAGPVASADARRRCRLGCGDRSRGQAAAGRGPATALGESTASRRVGCGVGRVDAARAVLVVERQRGDGGRASGADRVHGTATDRHVRRAAGPAPVSAADRPTAVRPAAGGRATPVRATGLRGPAILAAATNRAVSTATGAIPTATGAIPVARGAVPTANGPISAAATGTATD